jgi:hypothetical protein
MSKYPDHLHVPVLGTTSYQGLSILDLEDDMQILPPEVDRKPETKHPVYNVPITELNTVLVTLPSTPFLDQIRTRQDVQQLREFLLLLDAKGYVIYNADGDLLDLTLRSDREQVLTAFIGTSVQELTDERAELFEAFQVKYREAAYGPESSN